MKVYPKRWIVAALIDGCFGLTGAKVLKELSADETETFYRFLRCAVEKPMTAVGEKSPPWDTVRNDKRIGLEIKLPPASFRSLLNTYVSANSDHFSAS